MVVQIVAVVVGILLALFINNWVTHRQHQATAAEAVRAIHEELAQNRDTFHSNVTVLYAAAAKLLDLPESRNQRPRPCAAWGRFMFTVGVPGLTDAAYQIALSTHALSYMPFKRAEVIAQVYGGQHTFKQLVFPRFTDVLSSPHSARACAEGLLGFAKLDELFARNYAALIGPDHTRWPKPPLDLPLQPGTSSR